MPEEIAKINIRFTGNDQNRDTFTVAFDRLFLSAKFQFRLISFSNNYWSNINRPIKRSTIWNTKKSQVREWKMVKQWNLEICDGILGRTNYGLCEINKQIFTYRVTCYFILNIYVLYKWYINFKPIKIC